ncbi:TIGR03668 family PPOX class F420-dependent oxidoreductase [Streptomyces sp. NPDC002309]
MRLSPAEARRRFVTASVARLATAGADGTPHLVPVTFAVVDEVLYFAVDDKPKSTRDLRRLRDIRENPSVAVLADHYDEDWSALWWARADGRGEILEDGPESRRAVESLRGKYTRHDQYGNSPPPGPVVAVRVTRWSGWTST